MPRNEQPKRRYVDSHSPNNNRLRRVARHECNTSGRGGSRTFYRIIGKNAFRRKRRRTIRRTFTRPFVGKDYHRVAEALTDRTDGNSACRARRLEGRQVILDCFVISDQLGPAPTPQSAAGVLQIESGGEIIRHRYDTTEAGSRPAYRAQDCSSWDVLAPACLA
jgi:hypothetical protein